jgi:hypothetical protein
MLINFSIGVAGIPTAWTRAHTAGLQHHWNTIATLLITSCNKTHGAARGQADCKHADQPITK